MPIKDFPSKSKLENDANKVSIKNNNNLSTDVNRKYRPKGGPSRSFSQRLNNNVMRGIQIKE